MSATRLSILDALLLVMSIIWGSNYPIIKSAFAEFHPQAFNALRMLVAAAAFLVVMAALRLFLRPRLAGTAGSTEPGEVASIFLTPARVTAAEWVQLFVLGLIGHLGYQYFFIGGLARTSVANASVMLAATPVLIALIAAALGQERVGAVHWIGAALSAFGIYLVVGGGFSLGGAGFTGDVMMFAAVWCWALYTLGARPLMKRHSPVGVTGLSMALGALVYVPLMWPHVRAVEWSAVSGWTLFLLVYSALFALCIAYTIWYVGVRQIGSARTSVYSNFVPLTAMASAAIFLHEPIGLRKALGAAAVLIGVALTRTGARS
jgi:drug/metabolite transporter (DMT)-like permease